MILDDILAHKHTEVASAKAQRALAALRAFPGYAPPRRGFRAALAACPTPAVIAECKRASPSRGIIRPDYDPATCAASYAAGGAAALSVLTDVRFFQGDLAHLAAARAACDLPCLRKDFIIDPYQVEEARAFGADAILLIAAARQVAQVDAILETATRCDLDVLVEVHSEGELDWALGAGARLIGVNNRDLDTFQTDLATTERLARRLPRDVLLVAESGMQTRADVDRMVAAGAHAVLVGEAFMRQPDPGQALAAWLRCP